MSLTLITCSYVVAMPVLSKSTLYIPVGLPLAALESFMDQHQLHVGEEVFATM